MPHYWVKIPSSPAKERRDVVKAKAQGKGGRLLTDEIYFDANGQAFALVQVPADPAKQQEVLQAIGATSALGLVDADEKDAGAQPPPST
jgi:hypothetical protein